MNIKKILLFLVFLLFVFNTAYAKETDYNKIYDELLPADFEYIFGIDPYQAEDYERYKFSPYPLLRSGVEFRFKDILIPRGYYLLTPREKDGRDYILFKQNGRVSYIIPVYKKELVDIAFYSQHVPTPKKTLWQKFTAKTSNIVGRISKDSKKTPLPKAYIDVNDLVEFWEVVLYYGTQKYCLLFSKE